MNVVSAAFHDRLTGDAPLAALLATWNSAPAVFTQDPPPGKATLPYIITAGSVSDVPWDTKQTRGREIRRDVRCYTVLDDAPDVVEAIAERVRTLFHRQALTVEGFGVWLTECVGPITADEPDAYGRIVTVRLIMQMEE